MIDNLKSSLLSENHISDPKTMNCISYKFILDNFIVAKNNKSN